jgi:hypothetical protein
MRIRAKLALALLSSVGAILLLSGVASAHAQEQVGPFHMEIGFGTEPAYTGQPNSVQLLLTNNGKPVLNLGDSLKVTVSFGGQSTDAAALEPNFEPGGDGIQGDYRYWFVPTQAGAYTFAFTGTVQGTRFDVSVAGGPKTFSTVEDMSSITFPKVEFPANNELATRIQQDAARTQTAVSDATKNATSASAASSDASDAASTAKTTGIIGILVGAVGLIVAIVALSASRKRTAAA